jgi:hypothetical protein
MDTFTTLVTKTMASLKMNRAEATAWCVKHNPAEYQATLRRAGVVAGKVAAADAVEHYQSFRALGDRLLVSEESARLLVRSGKLKAIDEARGLYASGDLDAVRADKLRPLFEAHLKFSAAEGRSLEVLRGLFAKAMPAAEAMTKSAADAAAKFKR